MLYALCRQHSDIVPPSCGLTLKKGFDCFAGAAEGEASAAEFKLIVSTDGIIQMYAWPQADGKFVIHGLPAGSHLLDVLSVNLVYPQVESLLYIPHRCIIFQDHHMQSMQGFWKAKVSFLLSVED